VDRLKRKSVLFPEGLRSLGRVGQIYQRPLVFRRRQRKWRRKKSGHPGPAVKKVLCQMLGWGSTALLHMNPDSFILVCKQDPGPCPLDVPDAIRISLHHFRVVIDPFQKAIRAAKNKTVQDFHFPIPQSPNTALKRFNPLLYDTLIKLMQFFLGLKDAFRPIIFGPFPTNGKRPLSVHRLSSAPPTSGGIGLNTSVPLRLVPPSFSKRSASSACISSGHTHSMRPARSFSPDPAPNTHTGNNETGRR